MAGQETLIYIDENDLLNAGITAKNFAKEDTQNRAYYNTLGAQLVKKYLASENINVSDIYNIHSIKKVLEEFDISDIMLDNIHIDVRVVFNENFIFIPKSHFDYEILPDIYLVLLMSNDKKHMKFLGFFEPKLINKNNQNEDYYFIEKEKLTSAANLKDFIENFNGGTAKKLSKSEIDESDMMFLSFVDQDIDNQSKKQLLKNLVKSAELRDRFIEFENFELLAYKAEHSPEVKKPAAFDIALDKAAAATAAALEEFNSITPAAGDTTTAETDIMNSFNDLDRNIPDLTPEDTTTAENDTAGDELLNLSDLPEFSDLEDLTVAEAAEADNAQTEEIFTNNEDISDTEISQITNTETVEEIQTTDNTEDVTVNFDELTALDINVEDENPQDENLDLETVDLTLDGFSDDTALLSQNSAESIENSDVINFEDLEHTKSEKKTEDETPAETFNFEDITNNTIVTEQKTSEVSMPETVDFDDITKSGEEETLTIDMDEEPSLVLENFDNLNLDETSNEESEKTVEEDINSEEITDTEELQSEPDMNFDDNFDEELSIDTDLTLDEPLDETIEEQIDDKDNKLSIEEELGIDENSSQNEDVMLDSIENLIIEDAKAHGTELPENDQNDEDEELEQMLSSENLTSTPDESSVENDFETEPVIEDEKTTTDADEIAELNLNADEVVKSTASDEIDIEDFKELGISVEELPSDSGNKDVETNELISQIDDLLGNNAEPAKSRDETQNADDDDKLEMLFSTGEVLENENVMSSLDEAENDFIEPPVISEEAVSGQQEKGKKAIIVAAALVAVLAAAGGGAMFLKSKNAASDMISQNPIENDTVNLPPAETGIPAPADNTDLMTNPSGVSGAQNPVNPTPPAPAGKTNKNVSNKPTGAQTAKPKPAGTPLPYVSVKSIVWEVPDYLSYSDKVKKYLQSAGKSIRLSLSSDLLLANEYAYSNQVKVELKLKNDGTVESAQITKSSGSNQINDIVLRTVKSTLKVVKPAPGEIPTANFKLGLIINL